MIIGLINGIGTIVGLVSEFGVSALISNATTTFATKSGNKVLDKVMIGVGGSVLAGMAGEAASNYIQRKTDSITEAFKAATEIDETNEEEKEETEDEREVSE